MKVTDISEDFKDGLAFINLLEIIAEEDATGSKMGKYYKEPKGHIQQAENCQTVIEFIGREGIKLTNIGNNDLSEGNAKLTAAVIFALIEHYLFGKSFIEAKAALLAFIQEKIPDLNITGFSAAQWNDGKAVSALINALAPVLFTNYAALSGDAKQNWADALETANVDLKIPTLLDAEDFADPHIDERTLVTYLTYFLTARADRANCKCDVPSTGIAFEPLALSIDVPPPDDVPRAEFLAWADNVTVTYKMDGADEHALPNAMIVCGTKADALEDLGGGKFSAQIIPKEPGQMSISVKLDGMEVPGSPFNVNIDKRLAEQCHAEGPGLSTPLAWEETQFQVVVPELKDKDGNPRSAGALEVEIVGPKSVPKHEMNQYDGGVNFITFRPAEPGGHVIKVKLDGEEISGSPFTIDVGVPETLFTGWLYKKARGEHFYTVIKTWKHRFFVILPDGTVTYFSHKAKSSEVKDAAQQTESEKKKKGVLNVVTSTNVVMHKSGEAYEKGAVHGKPLLLECDKAAVQMSFDTEDQRAYFIKGVTDLRVTAGKETDVRES